LKLKAAAITFLLSLSHLVLAVTQQAEAPKGRIEGTILKSGTNEPITGIRVTLTRGNQPTGGGVGGGMIISMSTSTSGPPPASIPATPAARGAGPAPAPLPPPLPAIPSVITDREGKFVIPDLDAGSYRLTIAGGGYVRQEYGQRVFPGQGSLITLAAGQVLKDIVMKLTLTGNVSGRLLDTSGQPAVGVPVQLLKSSYSPTGQKSFQSAGSTRTNDRGEYRLYWVTPGRYFLSAGSSPGPSGSPFSIGGTPVSPNDPSENYVFTFYPGVTDIATATSLDVTSGNETGVDFLIAKQQSFLIRGRVVDAATNQPPASINVALSYSSIGGGGGTFSMNTPYVPATGAFEVRDVVPGSYTLQVGSQSTVARLPLTVMNNIDGLAVVLIGTFSVAGHVAIDGKLDYSGVDRVRVQLRAANSATLSSPGTTAVALDGTFRFDNVAAGEYRVGITPATGAPDYFVKDARFDRNDVLNQPLVLSSSTQGGSSLEIVISPNAGQVEGAVSDEKLQPMAGVQVVAIPDRYRDRPELFKAATTDQTGHFAIRGIPPGDYRLFAWEALENFAYFDPDLIKQVESLGRPLHVGESSMQNVDLRVIPATK
jgi:hypothetical protein